MLNLRSFGVIVKYYYFQSPIGDFTKTHLRPIGDQHAGSETHRRPTCLIGNPSETDIPD